MKANDLQEGMKVIAEDGTELKITGIQRTGGIIVSLKGRPNRAGILLDYGREWSLVHPDAEIEVAA